MNPPILCLAANRADAEPLKQRLERLTVGHDVPVVVEMVANAPLAFILAPTIDQATGLLRALRDHAGNTATRVVRVGGVGEENGPSQFDAVIDADDDARLAIVLREQLTRFVIAHAPDLLESMIGLLDLSLVSGTLASARESLIRASGRYEVFEDSVLGSPDTPDKELEEAMIGEIDRMFDNPERIHIEPGQIFAREGDDSSGIWIILDGQVELFRVVEGEDLVFHSESAGRIVGLMSLYRQSPIFFSCRARTECTMLQLKRAEIRRAIHESPEFAGHLIGVILRSMARRNRRTAQLLIKNRTLNHQLAEQKSELENTLADLREAQERLVESEKMSTLGTLAAGLAHELNNPVAAILRASDHLREDLVHLFENSSGFQATADTLRMAMERLPLSTREEREIRSALATALNDDRMLADGLFAAGIRSHAEIEALLGKSKQLTRSDALDRIRRGGQLGGSLRNLETCSRRISKLVRSLKVYARDDQEWQSGIDINQTIEDVVILLGNHLRDIDLHKEYGKLPPARCMPSQLEQVWTNLLINAIQAMDGRGVIDVHTRYRESDGLIEIAIEDHGPGIPPEVQPRLFQSRFTTRAGRIEFGLGLGLPISKTLIANHGGRISFESEPGRTRFTTLLPTTPPENLP
ncbi:MAG: sensor histidine kinase [Luteolibacter sp.]|jgi:two-component system, NtrC family, sensor kinase